MKLLLLVLRKSFYPEFTILWCGCVCFPFPSICKFLRGQDNTGAATVSLPVLDVNQTPGLLSDWGTVGTQLRTSTIFIWVPHSWEKDVSPCEHSGKRKESALVKLQPQEEEIQKKGGDQVVECLMDA